MRAAHRLREATQKQEAERQVSPVAQLLARLQEGSGEGNGGSRADAWKGLIGLTSEDGAAALDLLQQQGGGIIFLEACFQNKDKTNEVRLLTYVDSFPSKKSLSSILLPHHTLSSSFYTQRVLALRLLAACCQHGPFVKEAFLSDSDTATGAGHSLLQGLAKLMEERKEAMEEEGEEEEVAQVLVTIFLRAVKAGEGHMQVLTPATQCWTAAMSHRQVKQNCLSVCLDYPHIDMYVRI